MTDEDETGLTITLTAAQARVFLAMTDMLLRPMATVSDLRLNVNATDNLLRSFRRRLAKALARDGKQ